MKNAYCRHLLFMLALCLAGCPGQARGEPPPQTQGLHSKPWVFGQSHDRDNKIWHKGVSASSLNKSARGKKRQVTGAQDQAPSASEAGAGAASGKKGSFGLSWQDEAGTWKVAPELKKVHPDEDKVRDKRHILGAYAGVEAAKDFNIQVGPELILKDDQYGDEAARADQPDSALGLGMKFKYDF